MVRSPRKPLATRDTAVDCTVRRVRLVERESEDVRTWLHLMARWVHLGRSEGTLVDILPKLSVESSISTVGIFKHCVHKARIAQNLVFSDRIEDKRIRVFIARPSSIDRNRVCLRFKVGMSYTVKVNDQL